MKKQGMYGLLAAALLIAVIIMSGCTEQKPAGLNTTKNNATDALTAVKIGDFIEATYNENNTNNNIKFKEGSGIYPFEDRIIGMKIGEIKNMIIVESSNVEVSNGVEANTVYTTAQGEIKVFNVTDKIVYIGDKLSGETLYFNITLKNITFADETNASNSAVSGSIVTVDYIGKLKNGEIFDNGTISFEVGGGQMIPGFDEAVNGMKINENKNVEIPPDEAYGYPSPQPRIQTVPTEQLKSIIGEDPVLNKEYSVSGLPWKIKVIKIETVTRNITVKILNITSGMEAFLKGTGIISLCANSVSLDKTKFYECYSSGVKKAVIDADIKYAVSLGVGGTPTFFTGCDASIIEKICSSLPSSFDSCMGRLKTNAKINCQEDGKYLVYEFTDLQCPYCYTAEPMVNELKSDAEVKLKVKLFPLSFHKDSDKESFASECARDQGKFEEFKSCAFMKYFEEGVSVVE